MVSALADTGAQSNEMDGKKSNMLVIGKNDSLSISITTWAANKISKIISKLLLVKCLQWMPEIQWLDLWNSSWTSNRK